MSDSHTARLESALAGRYEPPAVWSPDGGTVVHASNRAGTERNELDLCRIRSDGSWARAAWLASALASHWSIGAGRRTEYVAGRPTRRRLR